MKKEQFNISLAYLAWGAAAFFYFYQYVIRIIPSIAGDYIKQDFLLSAEQFGLIGALYLYAYAFAQIPFGMLLDKYGIKRVMVVSILICIFGCLLMSYAQNVYWLYVARFILGIGTGSAFLISMKIVSDYLPEGKRGFLIGGTLTMGTLSAIIFSRPIEMLSKYFGWLETCFYLAMVGFIVLATAFLLIPGLDDRKPEKVSIKQVFINLSSVLKNKYVVIYSLISIGAYTPFSILSDLWGPSFIKIKFHLNHSEATSTNTFLFIGVAVGSLLIPWIFEKLRRNDLGIAISSVFILISYMCLLYLDTKSIAVLTVCLFLVGFWCGSEMLCFTGVARYLNPKTSGLALGVVNTFNMLGGAVLQQAVGTIMDKEWNGAIGQDGLRVYTANNYVYALSIIPILVIITFFLSLLLKDKKV